MNAEMTDCILESISQFYNVEKMETECQIAPHSLCLPGWVFFGAS